MLTDMQLPHSKEMVKEEDPLVVEIEEANLLKVVSNNNNNSNNNPKVVIMLVVMLLLKASKH